MPMHAPCLASVVPGSAGRADRRPGHRGDARKPVGVAGAAPRAQRGPVGGRLRIARRDVAVGTDRGELPAAAGGAAGGHPAAVAHGRSGADRRSGAPVAGGRAARDRRAGTRAGGVGRADRRRRQGAVSPSAGALGAVSGGSAAGTAAGAPRAGRGDRRADRSRSSGLAPRRGDRRPGRAGRRGARTRRRPRPGTRRPGGRRRVPGAGRRAHPRSDASARERALAAAQTKYEAGALEDALALLDIADAGPTRGPARRVDLLRARIAFASRRGSDAPLLLLEAARELERSRPEARARDIPRRIQRGPVRRPARRAARTL